MEKVEGAEPIKLQAAKPVAGMHPIESDALSLKKSVFQDALDKAISSLNTVSGQEIRSEQLIQNYIQGTASLEETMIEIEKANLSINLALTVVNSGVQTLKEIMQMPV
ncbi:MAG: flagellar hook-basal body complex protein FliE [Candidatus Margulisiibacteriota bacterium]